MNLNLVEAMRERLHRGPGGLSKSELAKAIGRTPQVVTMILKGERQIKANEVPIIAKFLGLEGYEGTPRQVQVIGYVGAGYEVHPFDEGTSFDEVEAPPGLTDQARGLLIRGDSMIPAYYDGDVVIYDHPKSWAHAKELIGQECVVKLSDGRMALKILAASGDLGYWTLISYNAAPLVDVELDWAAPVIWTRRAKRNLSKAV